MANTNKSDSHTLLLAGLGLAAAAGTYFFFGPKGKKHRTQVKGWMIRMKGEIIEKLEEAKDVTEPVYRDIVDAVADAYAKAGEIPQREIALIADDLKSHWKDISSSLTADTKKAVKKGVSRVRRKAA